jgi:ABC-type phosphate transport system substrate-binding protein
MRFTRTVRATAIAAAAVALVATSALSASADPTTPADGDDIVIVGSDTTEFVLNDLAALYSSRFSTQPRQLKSFNATGTSPITIRPDNPATTGVDPVTIVRPNGSGAGIKELGTPTSPAGAAPVDSARSSRAKVTTGSNPDPANLMFIPFAQDQLRWMANSGVTGVTQLTDAQLTGIYNCTITNWNQVGGNNLTIVPLIPQTQSGTRAEWLTRVGVVGTPGSCVTDQGNTVQEHDPAPVRATAGSLAPVSVGRYNRLTPAEKTGTFLGTIPSPDSTEYNRNVYQVVKTVNGVVPAYLAKIFGNGVNGTDGAGGIPFFCERANAGTSTTEAGEVIAQNGFVQLALGVCGKA